MLNAKKILIFLSCLFSISSFSLDIEAEAYTGVGINLGFDGLSDSFSLLPNILNLTLAKNYIYYEPKGTTIPLDDDRRNNKYIDYNKANYTIFDGLDRDTRDALYYVSRAANLEKTLLDSKIKIKDIGVTFRTKIKSKPTRVTEDFNYLDINTVLLQLKIDNFIGDFDLRYDLKAKKESTFGVEKYLDRDYDENTTKEDKNLDVSGNLNVLKEVSTYIKPKFYFTYNSTNNKVNSYSITPVVAVEPTDGLSIELGFSRFENKKEIYSEKRIYDDISYGVQGYDKVEYYKKYSLGLVRDIKNAKITSATGVSRIDGVPSGSLFGESATEFVKKKIEDFFVTEKKYNGAHSFFEKLKKGDLSIINFVILGTFGSALGSRMEGDIPDLSAYIATNLFDKINLKYSDGFRRYDPISFVPKQLYPLIPGYENIYMGDKTKPVFDIELAKKGLNDFFEFQNQRDVKFKESIRPEDTFIGTKVIDGVEYDLINRYRYIKEDAAQFLTTPLKEYFEADKFLNSKNKADLILNVLFKSSSLINKANVFFAHDEDIEGFDILRGIYFHNTEYGYNKELINNLLYKYGAEGIDTLSSILKTSKNKDLLDSKDIKNAYWLDDSSKNIGKYGLNFNIKYDNKKENIRFSLKTALNQPSYISKSYSTAGKGGKRIGIDGNEYNLKPENITLSRIDLSTDVLAENERYFLEKIVKSGFWSSTVHYITKHKQYFLDEKYSTFDGNIDLDFGINKVGIDFSVGTNVYYQNTSFRKRKIGRVLPFDEGSMNSISGRFNENVSLNSLDQELIKKYAYEKTLIDIDINYQTFDISSYMNLNYTQKLDEWKFVYGLNVDSFVRYIYNPNLSINGRNKFLKLVRDENGNPKDKNGNSIIVDNETEYSLKEKLKGTVTEKAKDKLQYEEVPLESKVMTTVNGFSPYIEIYYMPFKHIAFKNRIMSPIIFKNKSFDGALLSLESGISIIW